MADIKKLYANRKPEDVLLMLAKASSMAKEKPDIKAHEFQSALKVGYEEAALIHDWLADNNEAEPEISNHWVRAGRTYVLNNPFPNLVDLAWMLEIGERRAFLVMQELERRKIIRIRPNFYFDRAERLSMFDDLVRQMKLIAKRYRGRCEPQLLVRTMYVDWMTAMRLAQYGEEKLGLCWKDRPQQLL